MLETPTVRMRSLLAEVSESVGLAIVGGTVPHVEVEEATPIATEVQ